MTKKERLQSLAGDGCLIYFGSQWCDSEDGITMDRVRGWWRANYHSDDAPTFLGANFEEAEDKIMIFWRMYLTVKENTRL